MDVRLKVGKQLFTAAGPDVVRALKIWGSISFCGQKFHDIPNTVAEAVRAAADLGLDGQRARPGVAHDAGAREAATSAARPPLLIGVTC